MESNEEGWAKLRALLNGLLETVTRDLSAVKCDKSNLQHFAATLLYVTIVQSIKECQLLLSGPAITVDVIERSILEAYADLSATVIEPNYPKRMYVTFLREKLRHLNSMIRNPADAFHAHMANSIDPRRMKADVKNELVKFKKKGITGLQIFERFKAANATSIYETAYWLLCLEGHHSVGALEARHVIKGEDGVIELCLVKSTGAVEYLRHYDMLIALLLDSSSKVHDLLGTGLKDKYEGERHSFDLLRANIIGLSGGT